MVVRTKHSASALPPDAAVQSGARRPPVVWWAALGVPFLLIQAIAYGRWIGGGHLQRTDPGPDPIPTYMRVFGHTQEILNVGLTGILVYYLLIRPWRRERNITTPGLACLAALTCYWQDLAGGLFHAGGGAVYNTALLNWGSWYNFIPGWVSPRAGFMAEPPLFALGWFIPGFVGFPLLLAAFMRRVKRRRPNIGALGLCLWAYGFAVLIEFPMEFIYLRFGTYIYPGALPSLTLFFGHYYQFPIYAFLLWSACWAAYGALFYFVDDRGRSIAERGVDTLRITAKQRLTVRFLALSAFLNLPLFLYTLFFIFASLQPSWRWAPDVIDRSYYRNQLCGPGTGYQCPDRGTPVPRGDGGAHVDDNGELLGPRK